MKELNFKFKGERKYIQGPDVYNELIKLIDEKTCSNFDLSFHQIMTNNVILSEVELEQKDNLYFACKFEENGNPRQIYGVKNPNSKPTQSYPYLEEIILQNAKLDLEKKEISLKAPSEFSFIEEIVALNKFLFQNTLQKEKEGKWYFARLQTPKILKREYPLTLRLQTNFNYLLAKSEIFVNGRGEGSYFFGSKQGV